MTLAALQQQQQQHDELRLLQSTLALALHFPLLPEKPQHVIAEAQSVISVLGIARYTWAYLGQMQLTAAYALPFAMPWPVGLFSCLEQL